MPIPAFNYANIPAQGDPVLDAIIPGLSQGLQLAYAPKQMDADLKSKQLEQALKQIQLKYAPQQAQANVDLTNAQTSAIPQQEALKKLQMQLLQQKLQQAQQYKPQSSAGKMQGDYENIVKQYGENSPQAQQFQKQIQLSGSGKGNATDQNGNIINPFQQKQALIDQKHSINQQDTESKNYQSLIEEARKDAGNASNLLNYSNEFSKAYDKTSLTGAIGGRSPAITSDAQVADNAAQNMVASLLALTKGKMTNYGLQFLSSTKPSRNLNKDAETQIVETLQAKAGRTREREPFLLQAQKEGLSSSDANNAWDQYEKQFPVYDSELMKNHSIYNPDTKKLETINEKKGGINQKNLNKWPKFLQDYIASKNKNLYSSDQSKSPYPLSMDQINQLRQEQQ